MLCRCIESVPPQTVRALAWDLKMQRSKVLRPESVQTRNKDWGLTTLLDLEGREGKGERGADRIGRNCMGEEAISDFMLPGLRSDRVAGASVKCSRKGMKVPDFLAFEDRVCSWSSKRWQ